MKNTFLALLVLALPQIAFSQKVDLDAEPIPVQYLRLPDRPLPADYRFYSTSVSSKPTDLPGLGMKESEIRKQLLVPGYTRIEQGGDFNLLLTLADFRYEGNAEMKNQSKTEKDKNGKETTITTYWVVVKYSQMVTLTVRGKDNATIFEHKWQEFPVEFKSKTFNNYKEASNYAQRGVETDLYAKRRQDMKAIIGDAQRRTAERIGFDPRSEEIKIEILDTEKHPDFAGFQSAYAKARGAFEVMRHDQPLDSVKMLVQPALDFFNKQKDVYDPSDKAGKKLQYACLYNLSVLHFWLENWDDASAYANKVIENDYEPKDGKRLLKEVEDLKADLAKCHKTSRHFAVLVDSANMAKATEVAYENDKAERTEAFKDELKGVSATTVEKPGLLVFNDGKEVKGSFLFDGAVRSFAIKSNTRFAVDYESAAVAYVPDYNKLNSFRAGDDFYRCMPFKSANIGYLPGSKPSVEIMQVLYESPKIAIYLAYTGDAKSVGNPPEYVVHKIAENELISLNGMKFALNIEKGIKKEFGECPAVKEQLDKEGFKRSNTSMIQLGKLLETCL